MTTDTIVAVATPHGRGGIGVVRLSGPEALSIAEALINTSSLTPRHATFARVKHDKVAGSKDPAAYGADPAAGATVDQVVVTWFPAPRSYTGDDVVEVSAHGSPLVLREIVELACQRGARLAQPGEFTLRAYLNGRMDLVQAEAVADLIEAVTPLQARVAVDQLEGTLTRRVAGIEAGLFDLVAKLEASLDFPDEGFHFITRDDARIALDRTIQALEQLRADGRRGRLIREGRLVVITGRPNVGKSSLFNALAGANRAIVTAIAGTTRDTLTETIDMEGIPITLVDTAGVREAGDEIEAEGVRRAREALQVAALILIVLDGSSPLTPEDHDVLRAAPATSLIIVNKADQPRVWAEVPVGSIPSVEVSAKTGAGLDALRAAVMATLAGTDEWRDPPLVSNQRHLLQVEAALEALERAADSLAAGATEELVLAELNDARAALEVLTGRRTADDLLQHIFSRFCVGK